jgi:hypothetical protein
MDKEIMDMKTFCKQVLIIGGFYFIISYLLFMCKGIFFEVLNLICGVVLLGMLLVLCFKKEYVFLTKFNNKFGKSANYLQALGLAKYFSIIFVAIPGMVYGYKTAMAQYNGEEIPEVPDVYLQVVAYIYWGILLCSLAYATYKSFRK